VDYAEDSDSRDFTIRRDTMRRAFFPISLFAVFITIAGCATVKVTGRREIGAVPTAHPQVIYVADFALDPGSMRADSGNLPVAPIASDQSSDILARLMRIPVQSSARQRDLLTLMTASLVEDLRDLGLDAYPMRPGEKPPPVNGWLLRGRFTRVDEGNRLRRAIIGFGNGGKQLQLVVSLSDLAQATPRPFCEMSVNAHSRRRPGALLSLDPYVVTARFMLGGLDLDNTVMESAARVARDIARQVRRRACPT
jgi:hypothetical protein